MINKRIAFVGLDIFPIPAIRGGAIEALATQILDENEEHGELDITVFTICDRDLDRVTSKYKYSRFVQINKNGIWKYIFQLHRVFRKLTFYKIPFRSAYMWKVNRYLIRERFDVIFFYTSNEQVAELSKRVKASIIYYVGSDYLTSNTPLIDEICKRVRYFVSNQYICDRIVELLGIHKSQTYVMDSGIDISIADENERKVIRREIRAKHGLSDDEPIVLFCGRLSPEKGSLQLIQAVQKVPDCKLIIVGGANFSSNDKTAYVLQLEKEANKCGNRVIFTGYLNNHEDLKKYMYATDIAVVPSICNEAGSVTLLEYRVAAVPTIASNKGGMKYNAGGNTIFVEADDKFVDRLANEIQKLLSNHDERERLSALARNGIETRSLDAEYEKFCELIRIL